MRLLVFLTAIAIALIWVAVEYPTQQAQAEAQLAGRPDEIRSIALDGRSGLPVVELRGVLSSHEGETLDIAKLGRDRAALEAALVARGFLAAKVHDAKIVRGAGVFVTFAIDQGPAFHVRSVVVTGVTAKAAGVVTLTAGEIVRADRIAHARGALADRLSSDVVVRLAPDFAAAAVDVELNAR